MTARWRAPGRINLIGEHTDYNDGWVLPFAIARGCTASVEARTDGLVEVRSAQQPDVVSAGLSQLRPGEGDWAGYALGVVWALAQARHPVGPVSISLDSDVPAGAGLSSSAAVVCSVTCALDEQFDLGLDADELLAISRRAENDYVGAPTGGMDQLVSLRGEAGHALLCDMRSLDTKEVPFDADLLVIDTRTPHQLVDGEYRRRREGCAEAARQLGVSALRDIDAAGLDTALGRLGDDQLRRYVRHVVTEDERVLRTVDALHAGDLATVGRLLDDSHASMRDDFQITAPQVDLAATTLREAGALGARMTGGGFGGCVIALVPDDGMDAAAEAVFAAFDVAGFDEPAWFTAHASEGAHPA